MNEVKEGNEKENLIYFDVTEHRKASRLGGIKLESWLQVIKIAEGLGDLPETVEQYNEFLKNPVLFVTQILDKKYREHISMPISTEKLMELMEIDLQPLGKAFGVYNNHKGVIKIDEHMKPFAHVDVEQSKSYAETPKEIEKLNASKTLISAYYDFMALDESDFSKYGRSLINDFLRGTRNLIQFREEKLVPNVSWVKMK